MAKLTEQDRKEIVEMIKKGIKIKHIASHFNITSVSVRQLRDSYLRNGETAFILKKLDVKMKMN